MLMLACLQLKRPYPFDKCGYITVPCEESDDGTESLRCTRALWNGNETWVLKANEQWKPFWFEPRLKLEPFVYDICIPPTPAPSGPALDVHSKLADVLMFSSQVKSARAVVLENKGVLHDKIFLKVWLAAPECPYDLNTLLFQHSFKHYGV